MAQVVSVSSLKGGVGKTSVTLGLASAALARGVDTLVVDLDPHGDASTGLGVSAQRATVFDAATVLGSPRRADIRSDSLRASWKRIPGFPARSRLDVVTGSARSAAFEHLKTTRKNLHRLRTALERTEGYDLVLVDCPPALNTLTEIAWAASEKVLAVAEPSLFSVAGTERTMRAIARCAAEGDFTVSAAGVVVNKVREDSEEHRYRIEEMQGMFGDLLVSPVVPESAVWQKVQGAAYPVHAWPGAEAARIARAFDEVLAGLLGR